MGILLAMPERNRSGKGQMVEVRLHDAAIAMLHPHASNVVNGGKAIRTGNGHPNIAPYDLFPPGIVHLPPPAIGEHSREVLSRFGVDPDRAEKLIAAQVVGLAC